MTYCGDSQYYRSQDPTCPVPYHNHGGSGSNMALELAEVPSPMSHNQTASSWTQPSDNEDSSISGLAFDRPKLAPIFVRKRPRQALFAHPNNSQTQQNSSFQTGDCQPTYKQVFKGFPNRTYQPSSSNIPSGGSNPTSTLNRPTSSYGMPQGNPGNNNQGNRSSFTMTQTQVAYQRPKIPSKQDSNQNQGHTFQPLSVPKFLEQRDSGYNMSSTGGYRPQNISSYSPMMPTGLNATREQLNYHNNQNLSSRVKTHGPYGSAPQWNHTINSVHQGGAVQSVASPPQGYQPEWNQANLPSTNTDISRPTSQQTSVKGGMHAPGSWTSHQQAKLDIPLDCSLHCITASIQGMQHWAQYSHKLPIIFEVYGVVSSALSTIDRNRAKEFLLKDEQSTVKCVFYIIDRNLTRVTRGQWHRCVGNFDKTKELLRCVSIRPATEQERKLHKFGISASDAAMRKWVIKSKQAN